MREEPAGLIQPPPQLLPLHPGSFTTGSHVLQGRENHTLHPAQVSLSPVSEGREAAIFT